MCYAVAALQTATIRVLIGMAMVALQNFSTGLEHDLALLEGKTTTSSSSSSSDGSSNGSSSQMPGSGSSNSSGSGGGSQAQQQEQEQAASVPLTPEMQLAVLFRSQRKQLLVDVIAALADRLKQVRV